jgi:integrase
MRERKPPKLVQRESSWAVEFYDPRRGFTTRHSFGTDDYTQAEEAFATWLQARKPDKARDITDVSVLELVSTFYTNTAQHYPSKYAYSSALSWVEDILDTTTLDEFDFDRQETFVKELRGEGLADGTIARIMAIINTSAIDAYKRKRIKEKPYVMSVAAHNPRQRVLDDQEVRALLASAKSENAKRYLLIAFTTAARPQAIVDLELSQFDQRRKLLDLNPKGRKQVKKKFRPTIPICSVLLAACQAWSEGPLFRVVYKDHSRKLNSSRAIADELTFPEESSLYTIRHTVATELRTQGVPEMEVSAFLGHKPPGVNSVTLDYAKYRPEFMRKAADAIDLFWERINANGQTQSGCGDVGNAG